MLIAVPYQSASLGMNESLSGASESQDMKIEEKLLCLGTEMEVLVSFSRGWGALLAKV